MDLNSQLNLRCPNCDIKIEQRVQRRMNKFWAGLQVAECEGCDNRIQWHHSLHRRFRIGGVMFRAGSLLVFSSLFALILEWKPYGAILITVGIFSVVIGVLATYTPNDKVRVELVDET